MNHQSHLCACCRRGLSPLVFLCWTCLQRLPRELRKAIDNAREAMQRAYTNENIEAYRAVRSQAIAAAQVSP